MFIIRVLHCLITNKISMWKCVTCESIAALNTNEAVPVNVQLQMIVQNFYV